MWHLFIQKKSKESVISNAPASTIKALPSLPVSHNILEWTQSTSAAVAS